MFFLKLHQGWAEQHNFTIVGRNFIPAIATEKRMGFNVLENNPPKSKHWIKVFGKKCPLLFVGLIHSTISSKY